MPKIEETEKETRSGVRKSRREMATAGGEKMVSGYARRRESGSTSTKVFKDNRHRGKRRSKEKRVGVGAEKRSSR